MTIFTLRWPDVVFAGLAAATLCTASAADYVPRRTGVDFPVYTNNPPGKQLVNDTVRAAAATPALSPEETRKKFLVPSGFEVRLFASEPEVVNPVAMTWDERGRLWVLELYEYPKGAPKGSKGRDRIKILEDTDADGKADKVTVFADGFSLATGLALGNGGVYVGAAPNLYFLQDTNGDDKADVTTVLKTGFGMEDRHELLNGFAWGPDGWLYMTHGVFTHSKVKDPNNPDDDGVQMDAALARYHPLAKKFEVFADGTSNPWGVDWNERGDAFVSACVIQHLFHMAPGGQYNRQGGTWANPYGYVGDLPGKGLPAIVNWRHYRAAHAGITIYQGDQYPAEWRGLVFLGNIHQSAINCDRLTPVGSTYTAEKESKLLGPDKGIKEVGAGNFLVSQDPWVRPVSVQTGPDGALWVMDWYDKYPCYQNAQADPEGVDREFGRIWRVVWTGDLPGKAVASRPDKEMNLAKVANSDLSTLLEKGNSWQRRQAQRIIRERFDRSRSGMLNVENQLISLTTRKTVGVETRLAALWSLPLEVVEVALQQTSREGTDPTLQAWAARLTGESATVSSSALNRLAKLASVDNVSVRAASAAGIRKWTAGSFTVDSGTTPLVRSLDLTQPFSDLLSRPSVDGDTYYPHIVWMAMEPRVTEDPTPFFALVGASDNSVSAYCARRVMRRICDLADASARIKHLNAAMEWLAGLTGKPGLTEASLDGLIDAFKSKGQPPTIPLEPIFTKLTSNPQFADKARRLATLLGDTSASRTLIAKVNDPKASLEERLKGITAARETKDDAARTELLKLLKTPSISAPSFTGEREKAAQSLYAESLRALTTFGGDDIGYAITDAWPNFSLPTRRIASEVLVLRSKWSRALLAAVEQKTASAQDVSATARRALARSEDATVLNNADKLLGKYRASGDDKLKLIAAKRTVVLAGQPDIKAGYEVAKRTCFVCHKMYGEGADVGPDLTGVGRSTLDALLHNIIDPNEVVGNGYNATEVELKDGSSISGRIVEETPTRLKLVASGPVEHVIAKSDVAAEAGKLKIRTSDFSLMPEGLEQMPDADFRNLIWYLLNPPGDNRIWTPALRRELIGDEKPTASVAPVDGESVALWNPSWRVIAPEFEGTPQKLATYAGRKNVLMTHPFDRNKGAALLRTITLPAGRKAELRLTVAAHEKGDWELRVFANGEMIHKQTIDHQGTLWKEVRVDLSKFTGREMELRVENFANGWSWEFGCWGAIDLMSGDSQIAGN